jgi:hypothetical protein
MLVTADSVDPREVSAPAPETPPSGRRILHILAAVLVGVVLPAVVVGALVGEMGVSALFTGVLWGHWAPSSAASAEWST